MFLILFRHTKELQAQEKQLKLLNSQITKLSKENGKLKNTLEKAKKLESSVSSDTDMSPKR
jgi:seryl-tRNA(Sec) selenium transferase